ncbi:MAG: zinc ribbon domain-containing protein [Defluviitaleaceae bacterium]|nr:zinc ribbon domain-containing protein [Defluviitaleaceae bacterium]
MDDLKKGIVGVTRAITKGSGTLIKTTKLTLNLSSEEAKLNNMYTEIGKKVHEIYSYGGSLGEFFDTKYQEILAQQRKIEDIKSALDIAKGAITCPKCGKSSPRTTIYCPKCGDTIGEAPETTPTVVGEYTQHQVQAPHLEPNQAPAIPPEMPKTKVCNVCNSTNADTDRFCLSCGRIL